MTLKPSGYGGTTRTIQLCDTERATDMSEDGCAIVVRGAHRRSFRWALA
jgi:hypothetical protein